MSQINIGCPGSLYSNFMVKESILDDETGCRVNVFAQPDKDAPDGATPCRIAEIIARIADEFRQAPCCRHCGARRIQKWGRASGLVRYRCAVCRKTFNVLTGTALARLRHREALAAFFAARSREQSVRELALLCGIAPTTSLRWRRRFQQNEGANKLGQRSDSNTPKTRISGAK